MNVAITGIGTLTPAGRGIRALADRVSSRQTCIRPIASSYFDASEYVCQVAGQVPPFEEPQVLSSKMLAQTDRSSQMALVAALDALEMAQLPLDFRQSEKIQAERVGLTVATIGAGWTYVESEMRRLWTEGRLNPYGLTAGFPAGTQGHLSIFYGIEGRTRTFISERVSGMHALNEAIQSIKRGTADVMIAGGTEAPLSPLVWTAYHQMFGLQSPVEERETMQIGEGSTFLVLEEREHALRRKVPILATCCGYKSGINPPDLAGTLTRAIWAVLDQARLDPKEITLYFSGGPALPHEDAAEAQAIRNVFEESPPLKVATKSVLGHLLGAAPATDAALATVILQPSEYALLITTGWSGQYACMLLQGQGGSGDMGLTECWDLHTGTTQVTGSETK